MRKHLYLAAFAAVLFIFAITPLNIYASTAKIEHGSSCSRQASELKDKMRKLWLDHVEWTRNFIVSDVAQLEDKEAVLERLLRNQEELGNAIKPYYGDEKGNQFTELLKQHIVIAGQVVDAAKAGDKAALDKNNKLWYKNADEISEFLNSLNPKWETDMIRDIYYMHLKLVAEQAVARINKDWKSDIKAYDEGEDHMLMLADTLSSGIINQFPVKFARILRAY